MVKYRYITRAEADAALRAAQIREDAAPARSRTRRTSPSTSRTTCVEQYGEDALYGGLQITTSIDLDLQERAERLVARASPT